MTQGYAQAADLYWNAGWRSVLPVPRGKKEKPPTGYTGYNAQVPSYPDVMAWAEDRPDWNLALRFPADVVGLDVDAYGEKTGAGTLVEALRRWGPLPDTVRSTSRTDEVSGIRLYRKPADVALHTQIRFPEKALGNIEVVQIHHRYCMAWPSLHPEGRTYLWLNEQGEETNVPAIADLPDLPDRWVEGLRTDSFTEITAHKDPLQALKELRAGQMSVAVEQALRTARQELDVDPGSRHDAANVNVLRLLRLGEMGEPGVKQALALFRVDFAQATRDRNTEAEANAEYERMVFGQRGHDLIASTPSEQNAMNMLTGQYADERRPEPAVDHDVPWIDAETEVQLDAEATMRSAAKRIEAEQNQTRAFTPFHIDDDEPENDSSSFLFGDDLPPATTALDTDDEQKNPVIEKLVTVPGLANIEPAEPLIEGMLFKNTLAQISGHPGSYKTFFTLGMACAIAAPGDLHRWEGMTVREHGAVIYVAAEGVSGLRKRILAWCEDQSPKVDPNELRLYLYPEELQLGKFTDMEALADAVRKLDAVLVVFDTRARCSLGLDENDATEQGKAVDAADDIRTANGCTVLAVHHSAKNGSGGRGSSAWDGAVHSDLRVSSEGRTISIECYKHKDSESGCTHDFQMRQHTVSTDLMPDVDEEARQTLIVTLKDPRGPGLDMSLVDRIVDVLIESAPPEGWSEKQIRIALGMSSDDDFLPVAIALKQGTKTGRIIAAGTASTSRYKARDDKPHDESSDE